MQLCLVDIPTHIALILQIYDRYDIQLGPSFSASVQ